MKTCVWNVNRNVSRAERRNQNVFIKKKKLKTRQRRKGPFFDIVGGQIKRLEKYERRLSRREKQF